MATKACVQSRLAVMAERAYWYEIAAMLGPSWRVYGWNYQFDVTLVSPNGRHHEVGGELADRLHELAIERKVNPEPDEVAAGVEDAT